MTGHELADLLDAHGFDFFTGVPCSLADGLIAALERGPRGRRAPYIPAVREDVALGLAAGAWRGFEGKDAPEHIVMGEITRPLLGLMRVPHRVLARGSENGDLAWARAEERPAPRIPYAPEEIRNRFRRAIGNP